MKTILAVNASPRRRWNTALALQSALEGAGSAGAETKLIHLSGLRFTGCMSCFACKRLKDNAAVCVLKDDLRPVLEEAMCADALILGSPIYFGNFDAAMVAFLERLLFMNYTYSKESPSKLDGRIDSALVCTMNAPEALLDPLGYNALFRRYADYLERMLRGRCSVLPITDTLQFADYSLYMSSIFDPAHKRRMREEKFPRDLEAAFALGRSLALA